MKKIAVLLAAVLLLGALPAFAETESELKAKLKALRPKDYPTQPIEFVVVYPAGGGMDVTARLLAKYVEKYIDHRVIVVNKTGGAGLIGHTYLATQAKNDGYTVGITWNGLWVDEVLRAQGKWSHKNLTPVAFINYDPVTWIVSTEGQLKDKSLKDAIAMAKEKPGTLRVAMAPSGAFEFLLEQIEALSGAKFLKVPFQGGAPGVTAMLGGHVDIASAFFPEYGGHLEAGKARALAVASEERHPAMPDVRTFNEALDATHLVWLAWRYAAVPRGIPADRSRFLEVALDTALRDPGLVEEYRKAGAIAQRKYASVKQVEEEMAKLYKLETEFLVKTGRVPK